MATRPWREIRRPLSPEREAQIQADIAAELARMKLAELRKARQLTQTTVAAILGIAQGDVSKLERRTDAYVGTLRNYIEALGGRLRVMAEFPDAEPPPARPRGTSVKFGTGDARSTEGGYFLNRAQNVSRRIASTAKTTTVVAATASSASDIASLPS
jgi:transcriptional regulator with XRE-family HTH domain